METKLGPNEIKEKKRSRRETERECPSNGYRERNRERGLVPRGYEQ